MATPAFDQKSTAVAAAAITPLAAAATDKPATAKPVHAVRTAHIERTTPARVRARIISTAMIAPTIKQLVIEPQSSLLAAGADAKRPPFRAGQWLDCYLPGVDVLGGYSIVNSPESYGESGQLVLAVKRSDHPPAAWVHSAAACAGAEFDICVGGDFVYPSVATTATGAAHPPHVLFVAGGVGINPIISMLESRCHAIHAAATATATATTTTLLYSAATGADLIFMDRIAAIMERYSSPQKSAAASIHRLRVVLIATRDAAPTAKAASVAPAAENKSDRATLHRIWSRRIDATLISEQILKPDTATTAASASAPPAVQHPIVYLCGPPAMTDALTAALTNKLTIPSDNLKFEKWW